MKQFKISYLDDGTGSSGFWDGVYSKIELSENKHDPQLTDVIVYVIDEDNVDEEIISFELFGYKIEAIDYDYESMYRVDEDEDEEDEDEVITPIPWYSELSIGYFDFIIGLAVGYLLFHK